MSHLTRSSSVRRNSCVQARSDGQTRASSSSGSASAQPWTTKAACQMAAEPSWPCREPMARMCSGIAALHDSRSGACSRPGLCAEPGRGRRSGPDTPRRRLFYRASPGPWTSSSTLRAALTSRSRTRPQPSQPCTLSPSVFGLSGSRPHPLHLREVPRGSTRTAEPPALPARHVPKPRPRGVVYRPGEKRTLQRLHVQVLHRDHAMPGGQAVGELAQEVAPRGDASVVTRQVPARPGAALRSPFLLDQRPLQPLRPRLRLPRVLRRRDGHPVAGRDDAVQADVDPDVRARVLLARKPQLPHLEPERYAPLPVRAADDRVHGPRRQLAVPPDPGETRDPDEPQPPLPADESVSDAESALRKRGKPGASPAFTRRM